MPDSPLCLTKARVLIVNDDGIDAPGLGLLERIVRPLAREVWVVAPAAEQSGTGCALTLDRALGVHRRAERRYAVDGTPADSVLLALDHLMADTPPDIVLSGVNEGANLGDDVTQSGTIGAAMQATFLGIPAIALSQVLGRGHAVRWAAAEHHLARLLPRLASIRWPADVLISVNVPDVTASAVRGVEIARQGRREIGTQEASGDGSGGNPSFRIGVSGRGPGRLGTDLAAVAHGAISITPLALDLTHAPTVRRLKGLFA